MYAPQRVARRALIGSCLVLGVIASGTALADAVPPPPTVTVTSPGPDSELSGQVRVTFDVKAPSGDPVTSIDVRVTESDQQALTYSIPVAAHECDTTCNKSFTLDSAATIPTVPGAPDAGLFDDTGITVDIAAHTAQTTGHAVTGYYTRNNRPTVHAPLTAQGGKTLHLTADAAPAFDAPPGTTVQDVQLLFPDSPQTSPVHLTPATGTGSAGAWQTTADISTLPAGNHPAELIALDNQGHVSTARKLTLTVHHGFTLQGPTTALYTPTTGPALAVAYTGLPNTCVTDSARLDLQLDARPWHHEDINSSCLSALLWNAQAWPLPAGHHTVALTLTDQDGYTATWTQHITVVKPLHVTAPAATALVAGTVFQPAVTATAQDGVSYLASWKFLSGSTMLAQGRYPTPPALRLPTSATRQYHGTITLVATSDYGQTTSTPLRLDTRWLTGIQLTVPARETVHRGGSAYFQATLWQRIGTTWSRVTNHTDGLILQWRPASGGPWQTAKYGIAYPGAPLQITTQKLYNTTCFRVTTTNLNTNYFFNSTSTPVCFTLH